MEDYTKVCWCCGSKKVFPVQTWFKCDDCGATHVPTVDNIDMGVMEAQPGLTETRSSYSPTKQAVKEAAKAREKKATAARSNERGN